MPGIPLDSHILKHGCCLPCVLIHAAENPLERNHHLICRVVLFWYHLQAFLSERMKPWRARKKQTSLLNLEKGPQMGQCLFQDDQFATNMASEQI